MSATLTIHSISALLHTQPGLLHGEVTVGPSSQARIERLRSESALSFPIWIDPTLEDDQVYFGPPDPERLKSSVPTAGFSITQTVSGAHTFADARAEYLALLERQNKMMREAIQKALDKKWAPS